MITPAGVRACAHARSRHLSNSPTADKASKLLTNPPPPAAPPPWAAVCFLLLPAAAALLGGWAVGRYLGLDEVTSATYLVSSALCIAAIACLSQQSSARTGNALGLIGVSGGIAATLGGLNTDPGTYAQVVGSLAAGGLVGNQIAARINITDLPQMVAAYHSLVGLAAAITSIANIMLIADAGGEMDGVHMVTAFLGDIIGAITLTGSVR